MGKVASLGMEKDTSWVCSYPIMSSLYVGACGSLLYIHIKRLPVNPTDMHAVHL